MSQPQLEGIHNLNLGRCVWHPEPKQSIVIHIASANKKGCRAFYNTLRANQKSNTSKIEDKWHANLACILSVQFWDNSWRLLASIKNNNFAKWIQCQTLRSSLFTNNRVSKFKPNVSDQCDFCGDHVETPLSLFYQCEHEHTQQFWAEVKTFLLNFRINFHNSRLCILFGIHDQLWDSVENSIILLEKDSSGLPSINKRCLISQIL